MKRTLYLNPLVGKTEDIQTSLWMIKKRETHSLFDGKGNWCILLSTHSLQNDLNEEFDPREDARRDKIDDEG